MRKLLTIIYLLFSLVFIFYLILPEPSFPKFPPRSIASTEGADQEDTNRRGYFTDLSRAEVIAFYEPQFRQLPLFNIPVLTYRLNYPPEDAQTLIRDQTHSVFLEEVVHPFRESLFINGYEPKEREAALEVEGRVWKQKIIVKYVKSNVYLRVIIGILALAVIYIIILEWLKLIALFRKVIFVR